MPVLNTVLFYIAIAFGCMALFYMFFGKKTPAASSGANAVPGGKISNLWGKAAYPRDIHISGRGYYIVLAVITVVAIFVRVYQFGLVPGGLNQDGAMAAVDANALANHGTDRFGMRYPVHLTAWGYGQMSSLLSYLIVPFIKVFGLSAVTARLPQLIVSLLGLVCLYCFVRDVFGEHAALFAAFFAAVNPWHILQSRWMLDCNLYPHFFMFGVFFLNHALKGARKLLYLSLSMVMFGLCMYCYGISIYTMPVFLLLACIYLLVKKEIRIREALISVAVYLLVAWPFIMVMAINFFQWETIETPFFTLPYFPDSVRSNDILFFSDNFWSQLWENCKSFFHVAIRQTKDFPWNDIENFGSYYLFSVPFTVLGLVSVIKEYRKKTGAVILLFFLLAGVWCGLATNGVNINRNNIVFYPLIILTGIGLFSAVRYCRLPRMEFGVAAAYLLAFSLFSGTYFTTWAKEAEYYFFHDFNEAVCSLKDTDYDKYYITIYPKTGDYSPVVSELFTMFWLDIDSEYFQGKTEEGQIPYKEKFIYQDFSSAEVNPGENAVYVVTVDDLHYFDPNYFDITQFGDYCTVKSKQT